MRNHIGPVNLALLGGAALLAVAACQPKPAAPPAEAAATPAASPAPAAAVDEPLVPLKKDPSVPLLVIVTKASGNWCPIKVEGPNDPDCAAGNSGHRACRHPSEPVRWAAFSSDTLEYRADVGFQVQFVDGGAPIEGQGPSKACGTSADGVLDCKVKAGAQDGEFKYNIIMNDGACVLDPTIAVNHRIDDPVGGSEDTTP